MADRGISHIKDNPNHTILPPLIPNKIHNKAYKEKNIMTRGLYASGSLDDLQQNQIEINKKTNDVFRITTYLGYALMIVVVIASSLIPTIFWADVWIQAILIASVIGNNIVRIFKQLSFDIVKSTGLG